MQIISNCKTWNKLGPSGRLWLKVLFIRGLVIVFFSGKASHQHLKQLCAWCMILLVIDPSWLVYRLPPWEPFYAPDTCTREPIFCLVVFISAFWSCIENRAQCLGYGILLQIVTGYKWLLVFFFIYLHIYNTYQMATLEQFKLFLWHNSFTSGLLAVFNYFFFFFLKIVIYIYIEAHFLHVDKLDGVALYHLSQRYLYLFF